jgi:2-isopropylmalate synthase
MKPSEIMDAFRETYLDVSDGPALLGYGIRSEGGAVTVEARIESEGRQLSVTGEGNGPISAFWNGIRKLGYEHLHFETYEEHALGSGEDAEAVAYIGLINGQGMVFGVGRDRNTTTASFRALLCAVARYRAAEGK